MKLISRHTKAAELAARLKQGRPGWLGEDGHRLALRLGGRPDPQCLEAALGGDVRAIADGLHTSPGACHGCGVRPGALVQVGEEPETSDSATCRLCASCLRAALELIEGADGDS